MGLSRVGEHWELDLEAQTARRRARASICRESSLGPGEHAGGGSQLGVVSSGHTPQFPGQDTFPSFPAHNDS